MKGYPSPFETEAARLTKRQNLLPVWIGMFTVFILFILVIQTFY